MRSHLVLALFAVGGLAAEPAPLFNGRDFGDWQFLAEPPTSVEAVCRVLPGGVVAISGRPSGFLQTKASYRNYRLRVEWRWPAAPGNAGVLVHISSGPKDRVWPRSHQVQTKHKSVGDVLPMAGATFAEPLATAAKTPVRSHLAADSEKPPGQWNSCDITCRDGTIEVTINGVLQNRVTACQPAAGRIGFQLENAPYELRHVTLEAL